MHLLFSSLSFTLDGAPLLRRVASRAPRAGRTVLHGVFGQARPGESLAVMGASGAGKTTLIHALALRLHHGCVAGSVRLNGRVPDATFPRRTGYVTQEDVLIGTLTVRETLMYAAELRLPASVSRAEKEARVQRVLADLGLERVAESKIGTEAQRSLSGGERKRVAIGVELIAEPGLLFLDEPTSGLGARSALALIELLNRLCREQNRTIIYSIHQPRSGVFKLIDRLLLLADGRVAFFGPAADAAAFLGQHFEPCDAQTNPADYLLDVAGALTPPEAKDLAQTFLESPWGRRALDDLKDAAAADALPLPVVDGRTDTSEYASSFLHQCRVLSVRETKSSIRNIGLFATQLGQALGFGLIVGSLFSRIHENPEQGKMSTVFFIMTYLALMCFSAAPFLILSRRVHNVQRESRMYRASAFMLARIVCDVPLYAIVAAVFSSIIYVMTSLSGPFGWFLLICMLQIWTGTSVITFVGAVSSTVELAMVISTLVNGLSLLFAGFFVNYNNLPTYWHWMYHSSFIHYGLAGALVNEYGHGSPIIRALLFGDASFVPTYADCCYILIALSVFFRFLAYLVLRYSHLQQK